MSIVHELISNSGLSTPVELFFCSLYSAAISKSCRLRPDPFSQAVKDIIDHQQWDDPCHHPGDNRCHSLAFHAKQHVDDGPNTGKGQPLCTQPQPFLSIHKGNAKSILIKNQVDISQLKELGANSFNCNL
jgi:hypothetical protein